MDVIVLAGGFGTRLRPWTESIPKPLLPILDKSMIEHVLDVLPESQVNRVLIAAGYGVEQIREHFDGIPLPYEVIIVEEKEPLGTGGAIANCREHLSGGTFCVINGDLITSLRVEEMLDFHTSNGGIATISLWEVEDPSRFGVADYIDETGKIMRFQEKPPIEDAFSNLINAGTYLLEHDIFDLMPEGAHSIERDVYEKIAASGALNGFPFGGMFVDAGTPTSFVEASQACISSHRFSSGSVQDDSWLGPDSHCLGRVSGSSIGPGATVAEGCNVRNSVILEGAVIEENCLLESCLIGKGATISAGTVMSGEIVNHI
ncbi:MAG: NDP-sugar synthase [Candidatus Poseidoniales archaeon]|jgi:mannose-1-phosphate guanylyltransferase|nr:MAG: NDP-sugar synthase [Candidatus Poseidoniales archaeon]|tara:strand:- start:1749 stop:2699 length:951 start_codon:yes stop_codon:yes gene_type:complete